MKKKIICSTILSLALALPVVASAALPSKDENHYLPNTGTEIRCILAAVTSSTSDAYTGNVSKNGYDVYVQIYAKNNGDLLPNSVVTDAGPNEIAVRASADRPEWWGSTHSTHPTPDPYYSITLYVGDLQ